MVVYVIIRLSIRGHPKKKELGNMNYIISGKNIDVTEGLKNAVYDKLSKLEKYFAEDAVAQVTFSVEKDRQKIEVTIPMKGHIIRAEQVSDDMYVSIDMVEETIERQLVNVCIDRSCARSNRETGEQA